MMEQRHYTVTVRRTSSYKREKRRELCKCRVCGAVAFVSFFLLLGSAGALENDSITLAQGIVQMLLTGGACALFAWLAGGFDYEEE